MIAGALFDLVGGFGLALSGAVLLLHSVLHSSTTED